MFRSALAPRNSGWSTTKPCAVSMSPADRADAGDQADPVGGKDEDEDRGEEPERPLDQMAADDALEKPVEAFHQPLQEVLRAARHLVHAAASRLGQRRSGRAATIQVTTIELVIGKPNGARFRRPSARSRVLWPRLPAQPGQRAANGPEHQPPWPPERCSRRDAFPLPRESRVRRLQSQAEDARGRYSWTVLGRTARVVPHRWCASAIAGRGNRTVSFASGTA